MSLFNLGRPEYELVLMVRSPHPQRVMERISELESIGNYSLVKRATESLRDVYFDTLDRILSRHRVNLRLRYMTGGTRITLKQSPGLFTRNRNERRETELDWSTAALAKILEEISLRGVRLGSVGPGIAHDPLESLKGLGLIVVQNRETKREPRDIVSTGDETLAELAIDSVTYHFKDVDITLDELEIEAKSKMGRAVAADISKQLARSFGPELQMWKSGKLSTGLKIERLLKNGRLRGLTEGTRLKHEAYELLLDG